MIDLDDYLSWDAVDMGERVRAGDVTAGELDEACRALIDSRNPALNAVADLAPVDPAPPQPVGVFAGVPFAVKELLAVPGLPWTFGSQLLAANPAGPASPYVNHLTAAGLRVVCSATSSEFGLLGSTESALRGATHHPLDPTLSAGGSSGGSAVLVASGIVPMAHANDGGGSIRLPASITGTFGFLPSAGRCVPSVPGAEGLAALVIDHCITRTVRDSATLLAATERRGPDAPYTAVGRIMGPNDRRLRIGTITRTLIGDEPVPAVAAAVERTRALLDGLGHHLVDIAPPTIDGAALSDAFFTTAAMTVAGVASVVESLLGRPPGPDELEPFTLELIDWAATLAPDAGEVAARSLAAATAAYVDLFDGCDVVLSPVATRPPWPIGTLAPSLGRRTLIERTEQLVGYTPIHNGAGCPAMSVPLERIDGLPVGMHLAAAPGDDALLLELAFELEAAQPWAV